VGPLIFAAVLAQSAPGATADAAQQLERIRKAIAEAPAIVVAAPRRDGLVFRVTVHTPQVEKPMWDDWSHVPSYLRPKMGLYQFEYLQQVTPEAFRAGTLYTVGLPIGTLLELLGKNIRAAHRTSQENRAREEVRRALDELLACRADPSRPGC
jgi:hypothetical protein